MTIFKLGQSTNQERRAVYGPEEGEKFLDLEESPSTFGHNQSPGDGVRSMSSRTLASIVLLTIANIVILGASISANRHPITNSLDTRSAIKETSSYCKFLRETSFRGTTHIDRLLLSKFDLDRSCLTFRLTHTAPILRDIDASLYNVQFNGTLFPGDNPAFGRLEPGPEADALWETYLLGESIFPVTGADVLALGKDPAEVARLTDSYWDLGSDAYVASLDTTHKFHCLNELRKMTFEDYENPHPSRRRHGKL
ncbi:hypothetical protein MMC27_003568 [Xylographa pallens]|nr:hypothetical protein [Xylographa pallens]